MNSLCKALMVCSCISFSSTISSMRISFSCNTDTAFSYFALQKKTQARKERDTKQRCTLISCCGNAQISRHFSFTHCTAFCCPSYMCWYRCNSLSYSLACLFKRTCKEEENSHEENNASNTSKYTREQWTREIRQ